MKQRSLLLTLAGLVLAFFATFGFSAPANAATVVTTNNGVTCTQYTGGSWPFDGHYSECTRLNTGYNSSARFVLGNIQNNLTYPNVIPVLKTMPGSVIYIFDDAIDMFAWFQPAGQCCTAQQKIDAYNAQAGFSGTTLQPVPNQVPCSSRIWVSSGIVGMYPQERTKSISVFQTDVAHEVGHCFDWYVGGSVANAPSQNSFFTNTVTGKMAKDKAYMQAHDPVFTTDYNSSIYWLSSGPELFAEEFAIVFNGTSRSVDTLINSYWGCTKFYTQFWMLHPRLPTAQDYTNALLSRCN